MRKTVKLAAASALAAVALVGGSATAASAHGHDHGHHHDNNGFNICANHGSHGLVYADDSSHAELDGKAEAEGVTDQTVCQTGEKNKANLHSETEPDYSGNGGVVQMITDAVSLTL